MEDDLERSHRREAAWISVAVHIFALIFLLLSPKIFNYQRVILANPPDMMKDKQLTYLDMPPDLQTPPKQVKPDAKLSDKNRIAESRHPSVDQKDPGRVAQGWTAATTGAADAAGAAATTFAERDPGAAAAHAAGAEHASGAGPAARDATAG